MALTTIEPFGINSSNSFTFANVTATGNVSANYVLGNGSQLTGLPESYSNANVSAFLPTYSGNIGVGNLTLDGNITGNLLPSANVTYDLGSTSQRWNDLWLSNTTIYIGDAEISASGANLLLPATVHIGNAVLTEHNGGLTLPENMSAVEMNVTGNIDAGNINGNGSGLSSITGANVIGQVGNALVAGTVYTAAQPNITSVGTLTSVAVTGNATAGNFVGTLNGSGANISSINATNIDTGTLTQARLANASVTLGSTALTLGSTVTTVAGLSSVTSTSFVGALTGEATTAGTVTTAAQPNITSVGTLTSVSVTGNVTGGNLVTAGLTNTGTLQTSGNAIIGGNLVVNGNTVNVNITDLNVQDPVIGLGRGANNAPLTTNDGKDRGTQLWYYSGAERSAFVGYDNSVGKMIAASNVSIANEIVTVNSYGSFVTGAVEAATVSATGNVTGGNVSAATGAFVTVTGNANATSLTSGTVPSARLTGTYTITVSGAATTAGTVTTAAQPNITSVGTLTSVSVTGNVTGGNIGIGTANISAPLTVAFTSGTPIANLMTTDAAIITANATAPGFAFVVAGTSSGHRGVFKGTRARGTLESPEVPQQNDAVMTMLGAIYDGAITRATAGIEFTVDGTVSIGVAPQRIALLTGETNSRTERMSIYSNGVVNVRTSTASTSSDSGALIVSGGMGVVGNINSGGSLTVAGNITGGNLVTAGAVTGNGRALTSLNATNINTGTLNAARLSGTYTITVSGSSTTAATVTTAAQPNITSVGTLGALSVTGNITGGNISAAIGTFTGGVIPGATQGYPNYDALIDFGADIAGTWRRVVNVVSPNIQYSTIGFKIEIVDPQANHAVSGSVNSLQNEVYYVACVRTESTVLNTPDACYVTGPGNRVRATKTALGTYQIQIQNQTQYREYRVNVSVYAVNGSHTVTYHAGDAASAGTAQYNATVSATQTDRFQNISVSNSLSATGNINSGGTISAVSKSFLIDHPTKEGKKLRHGSLEGPENGVYVRGKLTKNVIELPEYWTKLVNPDSITVTLTPIGTHQKLYVKDVSSNTVIVGNENLLDKTINCYYIVYAERCDVEKMKVEID